MANIFGKTQNYFRELMKKDEIKPGIPTLRDEVKLPSGQAIKIRNIALYPEIAFRQTEAWRKMSGESRKQFMRALSPEKKLERSLLAQMIMQWRRTFPPEERQKLSALKGSFDQNKRIVKVLGLPFLNNFLADYHFLAAYAETANGPKLAGYSTSHASRPRRDLPSPLALSEYFEVLKQYRGGGRLFRNLGEKMRDLAINSGSRYIGGEVEPFDFGRYSELRNKTEHTEEEKAELGSLEERKNRLTIFSRHMKVLQAPGNPEPFTILDPAEHTEYKGSWGQVNRRGNLSRLLFLLHPLQGTGNETLSGREIKGIVQSYYRGPHSIRKKDVKWLIGQLKIPESARLTSLSEYLGRRKNTA